MRVRNKETKQKIKKIYIQKEGSKKIKERKEGNKQERYTCSD